MLDLYTLVEETVLNAQEKERALEGLENNYVALQNSDTYETMKEALELNGYSIEQTKYQNEEFIIFLK